MLDTIRTASSYICKDLFWVCPSKSALRSETVHVWLCRFLFLDCKLSTPRWTCRLLLDHLFLFISVFAFLRRFWRPLAAKERLQRALVALVFCRRAASRAIPAFPAMLQRASVLTRLFRDPKQTD